MPDFISRDDLGRQNLLKIDVQGFELEVLKSAEPLLSQFRWIYAECSSVPLYEGQALADEVIQWLKARRFDLIGRFNPSRGRDGTLEGGTAGMKTFAAFARRPVTRVSLLRRNVVFHRFCARVAKRS